VNVSPPEMRRQVHHRAQVQELVSVGGLLLGVVGLGAGLLAVRVARQHRVAERLDQVLASVQPVAEQMQERLRSSQLVDAALEERRRLARVLADMFASTPATVHLEGVTFERNRLTLVVRGSAASTQDVLGYIAKLQEVEGVRGVHLKYSTRRSSPSGERTDFELVVTQRGSARS